ncbi:MAG TPA: hypothetical protein VEY30_11920, partial [Myxococcaceae bacterium]|nr:hypothetical protein [Myxococcaceae bacterium]
MSPKRWGPFFTLWLCLFALTARAQSVVVLEFSGDRKAKLRTQVEAALKRARKVKVAPLLRYKAAAAKAKLRGGKAMTPQAVAALAPKLKLDAAVEGTIEETFFVRIIDSQGNELWSKDLPLKRGLISAKNAKRLAAAIATAAKMAAQGEGGNAAQASEDAADSEEPPEAPPPPPKPPEPPAPPEPPPVVEEPKPAPGLPAVAIPDPPKNETAQQRERRQRDEARESHTVTEAPPPETEKAQTVEADEGPRVGPRLITLQLAGLTTWRSFCARPGVSSCGDFDALAEQDRPQGERVDFSAQVPYLGIGGAVELFPLARMDGFLKGLGLGATYSRGFSLTNVRVESADGTTPETEVVSVEQA